jgi:hypothetical protein
MDVAKARNIAHAITEYLFVNGMGERAERLALMLPGNHDGGGWSAKAIKEHITKVLTEET